MAGGDKLRIAPGQLRRQLLQSFAEEPRGRGGGKKRGRGRGRGRGRLPNRSQSPPPSATSVSTTSPLQTRVSPVRDPPVQERTPMQDPPVQDPTPSHEEWGSWGDGEGAGADAEAEVEAEDEGPEAEDEEERRIPSASKSVYQHGMTRVPDRLELQHRALILPD